MKQSMTPKAINVGVINDPMGGFESSCEEEAATIVAGFNSMSETYELGLTFNLAIQTNYVHQLDSRHLDLLIIDYGGMSVAYGCDSIATDQVSKAVAWAKDHENVLVVIWTQFTRAIYDDAIDGELLSLKNVYLKCGAAWETDLTTEYENWIKKVKEWFQ